MLGGLALWLLDRTLRTVRAYAKAVVSNIQALDLGEKVTYLEYFDPGRGGFMPQQQWLAGQYVFLNIPDISIHEWHPFTVSSAPGDAKMTHHIKSMGTGTFTDKLYALAALNPTPGNLVVNVEGPPFGRSVARGTVVVA